MHNTNRSESVPATDYLQMILSKTRNDRKLALTIFSQLFTELPEQLHDIQDALNRQQYDTAQQITHKLHGSLSLCGLEDIRSQAKNLEQCLKDKNYGAISRHWFQLQYCAFNFTAQQQALLADLSREDY